MGVTLTNQATGQVFSSGKEERASAASAKQERVYQSKSGSVSLTVKQQTQQNETAGASPRPAAYDSSDEQDDAGSLSFWQRVWNTVNGAVKSSAAGMTDASRALYESGQNARAARDTETMAEYSRSLDRAKYDMRVMLEENAKAPGTWADRDLRSQQNIIDDWQRKYDAMAKVSGNQVQQKATQAAAQLADTVQESAQKDIETAKKGLGTVGRLAVDAGVAGTQMLGDAAANIVAPGAGLASMGYRAFGSGAQQARPSAV